MRAALFALFLLASATVAAAECQGKNLIDQMPAADRQALHDSADAAPYASGNFFTATKDGQTITLIGTYHLGDPRHQATMEAITPLIDAATTVLVEAGPEEERALIDHLAKNPALMVLTDTTLPELLPAADWAQLSDAMALRGIPGFMAAKFQPWYISMMLATPPCSLTSGELTQGLDARIIDRAQTRGIPLRALEPFDTVFAIFDQLPMADQIDMIRYSLGMEDRVEDFSTTIADSYFAGDPRLIWELMRHESLRTPGADPAAVQADMALMEQAMMIGRNQAWIPVITAAAADGPTLAAFGALHLSGDQGVVNLLARQGWTITPMPLAPISSSPTP